MSRVIKHAMAVKRGELPPPPVAQLLGLRIVKVVAGRAVMALRVDARYANPQGTLHGGIICDLADAAMGVAFASTCRDEESYASIELSCRFLRPVWDATLTARAHVVYRGKTTGVVECDVLDERQRLIATLSSTLMVLRGAAARGR